MQAQILNLLKSLQDELQLSLLFITHNIAVVEFIAHEVAVMYLGRIVEQGTVEAVLHSPQHPCTHRHCCRRCQARSAGKSRKSSAWWGKPHHRPIRPPVAIFTRVAAMPRPSAGQAIRPCARFLQVLKR